MMDAAIRAWAELIRRLYPELPIIRDQSTWQTGQFSRPSVYIETDIISERTHTPGAVRIIEDVGLVFHHDQQKDGANKGEPIPFDLEPLIISLRQSRYCLVSAKYAVQLILEPPSVRNHRDKTELTCRYSYLFHVPKPSINSNGQPVEKINEFYIESEGF